MFSYTWLIKSKSNFQLVITDDIWRAMGMLQLLYIPYVLKKFLLYELSGKSIVFWFFKKKQEIIRCRLN